MKVKTTFDQIRDLLKRKDVLCPDMVAGLIDGGLTSNTGRFLVTKMKGMRVSGNPRDKMRFSAKLKMKLAPNYDRELDGKYVWKLSKGGKYHGNVTLA